MPTFTDVADSFARAQKAAARSPHAVKLYSYCLARLSGWCDDSPANLTRRAKRDTAIIRIELNTGARRGELAGLVPADIDLDEGIDRLIGKAKTRPHVQHPPPPARTERRHIDDSAQVGPGTHGRVHPITQRSVSWATPAGPCTALRGVAP